VVINTVGSFALIWLLLWCALTVISRVLYPLIRPALLNLHPRHGVDFLLIWWAAPALLSLIACLMLFSPMVESSLITPHCHGVCEQHVPVSDQSIVAWAGLLLASALVGGLLMHFLKNLVKGAAIRRQLSVLASRHHGYSFLPSDEPLVFTLGWWRPEVFVSKGLLGACSATQLAVILDHESAHESRKDNLLLLLGHVFVLLILPYWRKQVTSDLHVLCEQACDFEAADKHNPILVAETLVHVGRLLRNSVSPVGSMAFDGADLTARVNALLHKKERYKLRTWQLVLITAVLCSALTVSLNPLHHGAEHLIALLDAGKPYFFPQDADR
jgi:Zn-dependent protease with chaperone function